MIGINKKIVEVAISDYLVELNAQSLEIVNNLKEFKRNNSILKSKDTAYLNKIIAEFETTNLITMSLSDLERVKNEIGEIPVCRRRFNGKKRATLLKEEILQILDYKGKRSKLYPEYFQKIGIKACVYCNSQLTVTVDKEIINRRGSRIEYVAKFQLDHFYPKDKYPHLSISIFNLYPVCSSCNLVKNNNPNVEFKLYVDALNESDFAFKLDKSSKATFLSTRNNKHLNIIFQNVNDSTYKDIFRVNDIYKTQYDVAEEIILKSLVYNSSYRQSLIKEFGKHRINDNLINRFILGNYINESEIHKRPLAKFMQDIGKETGLIE